MNVRSYVAQEVAGAARGGHGRGDRHRAVIHWAARSGISTTSRIVIPRNE